MTHEGVLLLAADQPPHLWCVAWVHK